MKLVALMLARNESWVASASIDAALRWADHLVFLNHASIDHTRAIAARYANETGRVTIGDWIDGEHWMEMEARQSTLDTARSLGATHIAIVDADEMLTHNNLGSVRGWFAALKPGECLELPMVATWKSLDRYCEATRNGITLGFADAPDLAWRPRGDEKYQYHNRPPMNSGRRITPACQGGIFHLQFAPWANFVAKQRHYMMSEVVRWNYDPQKVSWRYSWWNQPPHGERLQVVPESWWGDYKRGEIRLDGESWHDDECRALAAKHGMERFKGLDLFGWKP